MKRENNKMTALANSQIVDQLCDAVMARLAELFSASVSSIQSVALRENTDSVLHLAFSLNRGKRAAENGHL